MWGSAFRHVFERYYFNNELNRMFGFKLIARLYLQAKTRKTRKENLPTPYRHLRAIPLRSVSHFKYFFRLFLIFSFLYPFLHCVSISFFVEIYMCICMYVCLYVCLSVYLIVWVYVCIMVYVCEFILHVDIVLD